MDEEKTFLVLCDCGDAEHQIIFRYYPDDECFPMLATFHLTTWCGFFRRLWRGLRYAFGYKSRYGDWDDVILSWKTAQGLCDFLDKALDDWYDKVREMRE